VVTRDWYLQGNRLEAVAAALDLTQYFIQDSQLSGKALLRNVCNRSDKKAIMGVACSTHLALWPNGNSARGSLAEEIGKERGADDGCAAIQGHLSQSQQQLALALHLCFCIVFVSLYM